MSTREYPQVPVDFPMSTHPRHVLAAVAHEREVAAQERQPGLAGELAASIARPELRSLRSLKW